MVEGLVSTVIPVHNRAGPLRSAVDSVLAQDYANVEVIIVDDGSTDDTWEAASALSRREADRVKVVRRENGGPGLARETGRLLARGEFIQYLDSDDVLLAGKFRSQVAALRERADCSIAYGKTRFIRSDGTAADGAWKGTGAAHDRLFPSFLVERWWDTATPLYRKDLCDRAGPWTSLRLQEDWEYDCRIAALGPRLVWCDVFVSETRDHAGPRLSRGQPLDAARNRERARSHLLVLAHAIRAGVAHESAEMQHFARALFLLSRQCGASGLPHESRALLEAASTAAGAGSARRDLKAYRAVTRLVGWTNAGRAAAWLDRLRSRA